MPLVSDMIRKLKRSGIRELMELSAGMEGVIHLEVGEPLFNTPPEITEAAFKAARDGYTKYTPNRGFTSLREACSRRLNNDYGLSLGPENIIITVGAVSAIAIAVRALLEQGDEVLIPDPGWPNYEMIIHCSGGVPRRYQLDPEQGFLPSVEALEKLITSRTKALIINSPSNPLGTVLPENLVQAIVELARRKDIFVISDEVYEKIIFAGRHSSALNYDTDSHVIGVYSFSKTYAMTGWRVGYAAASQNICNEVGKLQEAYVSCACSVSQKAAEAALSAKQDYVGEMLHAYKENLASAGKILDRYGIDYQVPQGAFYMWVKIGCPDSAEFAKELLKEEKVAVAPGTTFGPSGFQHIRISLASPGESIREGLTRLGGYMQKREF